MSEHEFKPSFTESRRDSVPMTSATDKRAAVSSKDEFTGSLVPLQVRVPQDLVQSLRLHSIQQGRSMSDIVLDCLTSSESLSKAWVSTRRAG